MPGFFATPVYQRTVALLYLAGGLALIIYNYNDPDQSSYTITGALIVLYGTYRMIKSFRSKLPDEKEREF